MQRAAARGMLGRRAGAHSEGARAMASGQGERSTITLSLPALAAFVGVPTLIATGLVAALLGRPALGATLAALGAVTAGGCWWLSRGPRRRAPSDGAVARTDEYPPATTPPSSGRFARAQYCAPTQPEAPPGSGNTTQPFHPEHTVAQDFEPDYQAHAVPGLGAIYKELQRPEVAAFLLVVAGPDRGRGLPVGPGQAVTVGRGGHNHLALQDAGASATHCQFVCREGEIWVEDTASRNGTFVNNERVQRAVVHNCDVVALGSTRILVATL
ncbi:MAG: FHA domain-containing protein [Planctomycetota bacterium]|nr:MAG: FHA domain-containing protein [Planctomycetota bacterium]